MHISEIIIYPVKSLKGFSLTGARMDLSGLQYDRQWMVIEPDGRFMTQRIYPQMALIETEINDGQLILRTFGMEHHIVPSISDDAQTVETEVWGDAVTANVHDDATNQWLSQAIGSECKLVCFPPDHTRQCDPEHAKQGDHTMFSDAYPVLVLSQASLDHLNTKLSTAVEINRFRPNLVIAGCEPHDEDNWQQIQINDLTLRNGVPCARCSVPTVDPEIGVLSGPEPIHTLSSYRQSDGEIYFGMTFVPNTEGSIHVSDQVTVIV